MHTTIQQGTRDEEGPKEPERYEKEDPEMRRVLVRGEV